MSNEINKSIIDDMMSLKGTGMSILDIRLGHLLRLLGTKGRQYDWLMDVLEHPEKREQILREWQQRTPHLQCEKVHGSQER